MTAWIRSPRGSVVTALAASAVAIGLLLVPVVRWRASAPPSPPSTRPVASAPATGTAERAERAPVPPAVRDARRDISAPAAPALPTLPHNGAAPANSPSSAVPSFDVVRVDPHGETVVAGRGLPGAKVALVDEGRVLAEATADASGQFAILPPALPPGDHYLTLQAARDGVPGLSSQGVAVSVAADAARPMVALMTPDHPVRVLSDGAADRVPGSGTSAPVPLPVGIQSVETDGSGTFTASGTAKAGSKCRVYLNGAFLGDVTTGPDGRWSVKVEKGMRAGRYTVRADQLDGAGGMVVNRAEVPFDFPASSAVGHAKRMLMAKALAHATPAAGPAPVSASPSSAPGIAPAAIDAALPSRTEAAAAAAIIKEVQSATVVHGDSLWRISRKMLGHGISYTEIYASNVSQIRDPKLIYPGQTFVVPHRPAP